MPSIANVTVPVGVPLPGDVAVTVAVRVNGEPKVGAFGNTPSEIVVDALFTVWISAFGGGGEALPRKIVSPPYSAVIEWGATERVLIVNVALPPLRIPVPI